MCIFDFSLPIGWNELGVIATAIAVIIALWSNHQSKEQLVSALDIQEQSKNIELLDKRVSVIDSIEEKREVPSRTVKILFNKEIHKEYLEWCSHMYDASDIVHDMNYFLSHYREEESRVIMEYSVVDKLQEYEAKLTQPDCPDDLEIEFKQFCNNHTFFASKTGLQEDGREYNYYELCTLLKEKYELINEMRLNLIEKMERFIESSIKPLSMKQ